MVWQLGVVSQLPSTRTGQVPKRPIQITNSGSEMKEVTGAFRQIGPPSLRRVVCGKRFRHGKTSRSRFRRRYSPHNMGPKPKVDRFRGTCFYRLRSSERISHAPKTLTNVFQKLLRRSLLFDPLQEVWKSKDRPRRRGA